MSYIYCFYPTPFYCSETIRAFDVTIRSSSTRVTSGPLHAYWFGRCCCFIIAGIRLLLGVAVVLLELPLALVVVVLVVVQQQLLLGA